MQLQFLWKSNAVVYYKARNLCLYFLCRLMATLNILKGIPKVGSTVLRMTEVITNMFYVLVIALSKGNRFKAKVQQCDIMYYICLMLTVQLIFFSVQTDAAAVSRISNSNIAGMQTKSAIFLAVFGVALSTFSVSQLQDLPSSRSFLSSQQRSSEVQ